MRHAFFVFVLTMSAACVISGCKKEEATFTAHEVLLSRWCKASETLNYELYKKCEAYPREQSVFNDMYKDFYFADPRVVKLEDLNEKDIQKDFDGNSFVKRNLYFECVEVKRSDKKQVRLNGEAFIIKFTNGNRAGEDWFMANRTLVRLERN